LHFWIFLCSSAQHLYSSYSLPSLSRKRPFFFFLSFLVSPTMRVSQVSAFLAVGVSLATGEVLQNCTTSFQTITAAAAFAALDPGWNLGNTLDATPNEGSWNNPPVQASTFAQVKARGFKSIRIPGTKYSS
jgi:endoglucanase